MDDSFTPPETDVGAHHLDHYGRCALGAGCDCNRRQWKGRACPEWRPSGARSIDELIERARRLGRKPCV